MRSEEERYVSMAKEILLRLDDHRDMTLRELEEIIQKFKEEHPDMDIFLDGDERAICGRPKREF
ncbi:MAG: hypothetical protein J7L61_04515 [Thermoplasmata archaeon]|nr:hypothetical protein [Thermoplasmata archaeon]